MIMPKRFLYAAVLPLVGFIGASFFSYYAFADEAGEVDLNFWVVLEIAIVNFYCLIYLPLSFFFLRNVTISKFLYVLYVLVSFVLNFLYLAFGLFNITQLYLGLSALINPFWMGLVLSLLFIVVPAFKFFKAELCKKRTKTVTIIDSAGRSSIETTLCILAALRFKAASAENSFESRRR